MREKIAQITTKFINIEIVALAFLLPLFFLPITAEFFEINKLTLFAAAAILGCVAWGIKAAALGKVEFHRAPFDVPVVGLWIATVVTTIFSEHLTSSLIGYYGRWHPSLITVTVFTAFYFLITANLESWTRNCAKYALLTSTTVGGILFLLHYFGVNTFGQTWSDSNTFTPLGSPTILAVLSGLAASIALRDVFTSNNLKVKLLNLPLVIFSVFIVTLLSCPAGWASLAAAILFTLFAVGSADIKRNWRYLLVIFAAFVISAVVILIPSVSSKTPFKDGSPREITLDLKTSWSIAATSFRQKPFWGSGPSTFLFDFTRYKPLDFNYAAVWQLRFNKPLSEYLLAFGEMGLLGVLAYLLLLVVFIREAFRHRKEISIPLAAGLLAAFFFTYANTISTFFLLLALASVVKKPERTPDAHPATPAGSTAGYTVLILISIFALLLGIAFFRTYGASIAQRKAVLAFNDQNYRSAYLHQAQTVQLSPWQDIYHANLGRISSAWAGQIAAKKDLTDDDKKDIQMLVAQAIQEAKTATELSPLDVNNWEMISQTYQNMIGFADGAADWAVNSYLQAINLDVFNPLLRINLGGIYYMAQDYERALDQFKAAVSLKTDLANAHYNLGRTYQAAGQIDQAITEIETALRLAPEGSAGYDEAKKILDQLKEEQKKKSKATGTGGTTVE